MKVIIKRELINYLKNPLYWLGILITVISIYGCLSSYLNIHMFSSEKEIENLPKTRVMDADVMDGYIPTSTEERINIGLSNIKETFIKGYDMTEPEAEKAVKDVKAQSSSIPELTKYLEDKYSFYDGKAVFLEAKQKKGSMDEVNLYISSKLKEHTYSYYFAKKYADFAGLHMAFFSCVLLAFLFVRDMKNDTYELLHTKPISARNYVWGKFFGGVLPLTLAVLIVQSIFCVACQRNSLQTGVLSNLCDMFIVSMIYVMPTVLIITSIYILISILFKNPLPALPLVLVYIIYSNMGGYDQSGNYGFHGQILGILFRFEGKFFETKAQPIFLLNEVGLVILMIVFIVIGIWRWKEKRL